jgi:hypothetical protein
MCSHLSDGTAGAVDALLTRDYPATDLLARAAAAAGADVAECVALAWERFIGDAVGRASADGTRGALLGQVVMVLYDLELLDAAPVPVLKPPAFLPSGNRWAGWWEEDLPTWPPGAALLRPHVAAALRKLSLGPRVLLVLRDAAGLSPEEAEPIVNVRGSGQNQLLDKGRQAYVAALDDQLAGAAENAEQQARSDCGDEDGQPADTGEQAQPRPEIRASDVSCDVIVGLIGRWLDGDMDDGDRDAYEQHLLFCPPCLVQTGKTRRALTALREIPAAVPDERLMRRLVRLGTQTT